MARFNLLGTAPIPGQGTQLRLLQRNDEFTIKIAGTPGDLMNSRMHGSEDALATLGCKRIAAKKEARILVGGLGMGFTLAAALKTVNKTAEVTVAELIPEIVEWNQGPLGEVAGNPLKDPRTKVHVGDVGQHMKQQKGVYDAILLDVDNGPEGLTRKDNNWIYSPQGLAAAKAALRPGGMVAYWSAGDEPAFTQRLKKTGFNVKTEMVRAHRKGRGAKHVIWLAW